MSSFSVLNDVDELTSKAVLGSDGAARWQDFRSNNKIKTTASVAPAIPLKKLDRALGTKSISDERATEAKIRKDAGDRELNAGYTEFKRKNDHEEIAAKKKRKLILDRVRPDDKPYFFPAETFEGSKFDYVFTTHSRGTGYYWDGWDSMKRELEGEKFTVDTRVAANDEPINSKQNNQVEPKVKKKKKRKLKETIIESDEFNPMEQVAQALRRKQTGLNTAAPMQRREVSVSDAVSLGASTNLTSTAATETLAELENLPSGWESAKDPSSGKAYYFCRTTAERRWTKPVLEDALPAGWKTTKDPSTSKLYYYHSDGRTSWTKPTE